MYSNRRSRVIDVPEAPVHPVITKAEPKPIKTKKVEHVDVGDIILETELDEAFLSDLVTPVNRGAVNPPKKSYTPKVNKNFRPNTQLLHKIERSVQNQPRDYVDVEVGKAGTMEHLGTHHPNVDNLITSSGKLKNNRASYKPRDNIEFELPQDYSTILNLPSDMDVVPDLKETIPHPSVKTSKAFDYQTTPDQPDVKLNKKYNINELTNIKDVPFEKPLDIRVEDKPRKYDASIRYDARKNVKYTTPIDVNQDNIKLDAKYDPQNIKTSKVLPINRPLENQEVHLETKSVLQPSKVVKDVTSVFGSRMDYQEIELDTKSALQPSRVEKNVTSVFAGHMDHPEIELDIKSALQPSKVQADVTSVFSKGVEHQEIHLDKKSSLQPIKTEKNTSAVYNKPMDNQNIKLQSKRENISQKLEKNIPFEKNAKVNPNVRIARDTPHTISVTPGHSGGYMTQSQIDYEIQKNEHDAKKWMANKQQKPIYDYSFDNSGKGRQGYFPEGNVPSFGPRY